MRHVLQNVRHIMLRIIQVIVIVIILGIIMVLAAQVDVTEITQRNIAVSVLILIIRASITNIASRHRPVNS
nr:MAG TPA: hypothetical protein [Caudoviricetes sp.]